MTARVSKAIGAGAALTDWYCVASYPVSTFPYTWKLGTLKTGRLTGLWEAGRTITVIYTVNDEGNENVTYSGYVGGPDNEYQ